MDNQELTNMYNQCIDELARYTLAKLPVSEELLITIERLQKAMRDNDISRAMNQFIEKNTPKNCIDLMKDIKISEAMKRINETEEKLISKDYIDLIPRKELVNDILRTSTNAAEFKQPIGADSTYHILQQSREYLTKMDSPKAAELTETTSIQYKK